MCVESNFGATCYEKFRKQMEFCMNTKYASGTVKDENWNNIQWSEVKETVRLFIVKARQKG
ncbi:MAG: hypothetical protein PWQ17_2693 [Anaerophaga sp.]|nr:hypothetical protein [Anaerophaga sp.]